MTRKILDYLSEYICVCSFSLLFLMSAKCSLFCHSKSFQFLLYTHTAHIFYSVIDRQGSKVGSIHGYIFKAKCLISNYYRFHFLGYCIPHIYPTCELKKANGGNIFKIFFFNYNNILLPIGMSTEEFCFYHIITNLHPSCKQVFHG